jgi:hypothetical protein
MTEAEDDSDNHHLWLNRRTWWVAFTVLRDGYRQERIRLSLGTRDVATARLRRDALMKEYADRPAVALSVRLARSIMPRQCDPECGGC